MTHRPDAQGGFVVLDPDLPGRSPLSPACSYPQAPEAVSQLQGQFHDQVDANGEGGARTVMRLVVVPVDATGQYSAPVHWCSVNGIRPQGRF